MPPLRRTARMLAIALARIAFGVFVVIVVAAIAFAIPRWARPDLYADQPIVDGVLDAMGRALFHFDFGVACGWPGCPPIRDMWARGYAADIWLLFGTVALGVGGGFGLGVWCVRRAATRRARTVEGLAAALYCAPVYVLGLGVLLLFHGTFGRVPLPYFFDAAPVWASPFQSPWDWFRTMLVPWIVAAAPLAAMCLRLVVALLREELHSDYARTAIAKGVPSKRVVSRHAGPFARAATVSLVGVSAPIVVTNLILVERVFAVPGFFFHTWRATGHSDTLRRTPAIDFEMLAAIAIWSAVFIVVISLAVEFALRRIDPRVRTA